MSGLARVALVQAHPHIPVWHDYYVPDLVELAALAAAIRPFADDVFLPVGPTDRAPEATFARFLDRHHPDLIGISAFTCGVRSALRYAAAAKRAGATVVLGGYHPSARPEELLASRDVDIVVRGEGEETLAELVRTGSPEGVAGTSWRAGGPVVHEPPRPPIADLDALPLPLRELRPERCGLSGLDYHTDTVYGSRGCRGRCVFCANHLVGGSWRSRRVERVMEELLTIRPPRGRRRKHVKFWDSSFLAEPERVEALCRSILAHGLERRFRFVAESRVEDVVRAAEMLPLLHEAGFVRIGCGVESPHRETHLNLSKGINLRHVDRAAELLARAGIQLSKFLIVGHDGEDESAILGYPDYALSHGVRLQNTTFFVMTPYPGTELDARYEAAGRIASRDWDLYTNLAAVVTPDGITAERLQVLHAAVGLRYKCWRRFAAGRTAGEVLAAAVEPLLLLASVELARDPNRPRREVAECLHAALAAAAGSTRRPARRRRADRLAARFLLADAEPLVLAVRRAGDEDELRLAVSPERGVPGARELRISLERVVALVAGANHRRLAADLMTLRYRARRFRPAWVPSFAGDVLRLAAACAGLAAAHLLPAPRGQDVLRPPPGGGRIRR